MRFLPLNMTSPAATSAGGRSRPATPKSMVDLPQPDSPTTPRNSPGATVKLTASTARAGSPAVTYSTVRPRTSSTGASAATLAPHRSERGVAQLVEGIVEQGEAGAEQGDAHARDDGP